MKSIIAALASALFGSLITPASAAVTYYFKDDAAATSFEITVDNFITAETTLTGVPTSSGSSGQYCFVGLVGTCTSIDFNPNKMYGTYAYDELTIDSTIFFPIKYDFVPNSFNQYGNAVLATSNPADIVTLTISPSPVPLPSAAPLFGLALVALGIGRVRRRAIA